MADSLRFNVLIPGGHDLSSGMRRQFSELGIVVEHGEGILLGNVPGATEKAARRRIARITYIDEDDLTAAEALGT